MKIERMKGIESVYRSNSLEENLRLWKAMLTGDTEEVSNPLRDLSLLFLASCHADCFHDSDYETN